MTLREMVEEAAAKCLPENRHDEEADSKVIADLLERLIKVAWEAGAGHGRYCCVDLYCGMTDLVEDIARAEKQR